MTIKHQAINERTRTDSTSDSSPQVATPGRPIDSDKDAAILLAARELLFTEGFQAVTMESVAKRASVSKVTVYSRHANRNELIVAVMKRQADVFSAAFTPEPGKKCNVRDALLAFSLAILNFLVSEEHIQFMRTISAAHNTELALTNMYEQGPHTTLESLTVWLDVLAAEGQIRCSNTGRSAELFLGMLLGMDLVRALYGVSLQYDDNELNTRAAFVVDTFLALHT